MLEIRSEVNSASFITRCRFGGWLRDLGNLVVHLPLVSLVIGVVRLDQTKLERLARPERPDFENKWPNIPILRHTFLTYSRFSVWLIRTFGGGGLLLVLLHCHLGRGIGTRLSNCGLPLLRCRLRRLGLFRLLLKRERVSRTTLQPSKATAEGRLHVR